MNLLFGSYNLRSRSVPVRYAHGAGLNQLIRFPILQMKFYFYFYQNVATINCFYLHCIHVYVKHFKNSNSMYIYFFFACASKKWQNNQRIDGGRILLESQADALPNKLIKISTNAASRGWL
jgi:hypothetical protein